MKIKNTVPIPVSQLINYASDDCSLSLIGLSKYHTDIISLDSDTMGLISRFPVETVVNPHVKYCLDDSCLYLPTKMGQILALDKFSGEILATMNTAMPIMANLAVDDENIYCICGVPLSRQWKLVTDNFCICIFDKETGHKKVQTSYFSALPGFLNVSEHILVSAGTQLLQYTKNGELKLQAQLGVSPDYAPLMTPNHIIYVSMSGIIRVFNTKDLSSFANIRAVPSKSNAVLTENEEILWFTENGICRADYKKQSFKVVTSNKTVLSSILLNEKMFGCDKNGILVQFDLKTNETQSVKLSDKLLNKPVQVDNYLFIASASHLYQIEVEPS